MTKIAYLANPYPAISHTFIYREIEALRNEGFHIETASIHRAPDIDKMSGKEQKEAENTFILKEAALSLCFMALFSVFLHSPGGFLRMTIKAISFRKSGTSLTKCLGYLAEAILLIHWLRKKSITHIHEHFGNPTALVAMLCKSYGGFSYSISLHGPDIFYQVDSTQLLDKVQSADFIRCISHYCKSQVMRIADYPLWSHFNIVRCGVDPALYTPVDSKHDQEPKPVPTILSVGRLCPAKGQHILLESCAELKNQNIDFQLILVGGGPDKKSLERLTKELDLQDRVTFTGVLGQTEVHHYYRMADAFVLPSFAEGVPVVLMEAMAMALPVVSTRITGIPELIEHGRDGLLATPGDSKELCNHLKTILSDRDLCRRLGTEARKKVTNSYNQRKNSRELASLFKQYGETDDRS